MLHRTAEELAAYLDHLRCAPRVAGTLELMVRRPAEGEREVLAVGVLDPEHGLIGDTWRLRGSSSSADGSAHPDRQVTVMSNRMVAFLAVDPERRPLAGDQLYVDLDLSRANLPPGSRLGVGEAVIEVTAQPHLGCAKFMARFGEPAMRLVNSRVGRELRLRGLNARVVRGGVVRTGDRVARLDVPALPDRLAGVANVPLSVRPGRPNRSP
jgi:hypothetical protein